MWCPRPASPSVEAQGLLHAPGRRGPDLVRAAAHVIPCPCPSVAHGACRAHVASCLHLLQRWQVGLADLDWCINRPIIRKSGCGLSGMPWTPPHQPQRQQPLQLTLLMLPPASRSSRLVAFGTLAFFFWRRLARVLKDQIDGVSDTRLLHELDKHPAPASAVVDSRLCSSCVTWRERQNAEQSPKRGRCGCVPGSRRYEKRLKLQMDGSTLSLSQSSTGKGMI